MEQKNPLAEYLHKYYNYVLRYKKEVLIGAVSIVGFILLFIGYGFYKDRVQRRAHKDLVRALKVFNYPVKPEEKEDAFEKKRKFFVSEKEKWTKINEVFEDGYQRNKSAGIAPMFLTHQSESLLRLGKVNQAIDVLKQALGMMSKSYTSFFYYKAKLALMQIDSASASAKKEGIENLKEMALNQQNASHDMVLYRLGEYYWYEKNFDEAKNYWNQLLIKYGKTAQNPSWWASLAKPKLKLITSK